MGTTGTGRLIPDLPTPIFIGDEASCRLRGAFSPVAFSKDP